jgi:hypothetical protein
MIVIADATPLHYLILIHQDDLLPQLFDRVFVPPAVFDELQHANTPESVRHWMSHPPSWLKVEPLRSAPDPSLNYLDPGEREAIALAEEIHADQLLVRDRLSCRSAADTPRANARRRSPSVPAVRRVPSREELSPRSGVIGSSGLVGCQRPVALARIQSTTSCSTHATAFDEIVSKLELSQFMSSGESHRDRRGAEHCGREC